MANEDQKRFEEQDQYKRGVLEGMRNMVMVTAYVAGANYVREQRHDSLAGHILGPLLSMFLYGCALVAASYATDLLTNVFIKRYYRQLDGKMSRIWLLTASAVLISSTPLYISLMQQN